MSASVASTGLVSLSNKGNIFNNSFCTTAEDTHKKRIRRMQRGVINSARLINNNLISSGFKFRAAFITLTYSPENFYDSNHIKECIRLYRLWSKRRGFTFRYAWALELTDNKKPHYHLVAWLPRGVTPPFPDKQGWWKHGSTQAQWARSPVGYLAKYASKGASGDLPKGARLWGSGGLDVCARAEMSYLMAPAWLKKVVPYRTPEYMKKIRRVTMAIKETCWRGITRTFNVTGWLDTLSGITFESPWVSDGFTVNGLNLRSKGFIHAISHDGDTWKIPFQSHKEVSQ